MGNKIAVQGMILGGIREWEGFVPKRQQEPHPLCPTLSFIPAPFNTHSWRKRGVCTCAAATLHRTHECVSHTFLPRSFLPALCIPCSWRVRCVCTCAAATPQSRPCARPTRMRATYTCTPAHVSSYHVNSVTRLCTQTSKSPCPLPCCLAPSPFPLPTPSWRVRCVCTCAAATPPSRPCMPLTRMHATSTYSWSWPPQATSTRCSWQCRYHQ